jgi:hypothetical protein
MLLQLQQPCCANEDRMVPVQCELGACAVRSSANHGPYQCPYPTLHIRVHAGHLLGSCVLLDLWQGSASRGCLVDGAGDL